MLSIIVPCFNEESSLPLFFEETEKVKDQVGMPFEYLFINDGSSDQTLAVMRKLHQEHPDMGYRRLNDKLRHQDKIRVNDKRILRICRKQQIRSNLKYRYDGCTRHPGIRHISQKTF